MIMLMTVIFSTDIFVCKNRVVAQLRLKVAFNPSKGNGCIYAHRKMWMFGDFTLHAWSGGLFTLITKSNHKFSYTNGKVFHLTLHKMHTIWQVMLL